MVISTDETEDYVGKIKEVVGEKGAWAAFDAIAGDVPGKLVSVVRLDGTILVYGKLPNTLSLRWILSQSLTSSHSG